MKYNRPAFAVIPDATIWYYITQVNDVDNTYNRLFFHATNDHKCWYDMDTGEVASLTAIDLYDIAAVFAKFFAKEAGLDWYT